MTPPGQSLGDRYARYVLGVLLVVMVFNFLDRQIVSILAERIKADLGLNDAEIGFLYGTAFAVFYAIFGIPLGRLADVWNRRKLIALGLAAWSVMTALSGLSRDFFELAVARIGVGIGEASASPAAYSLLCDYFPAARRATVLAIYSSGIYLGAGLGIGVGGQIVGRWDAAFAAVDPPFGLRGWQVAFFVVGLPGLLLALVVARLREPVRGAADGLPPPTPEPHPFREAARELRAVLPPLTLVHLLAVGASRRTIALNLAAAGGVALLGVLLTRATGTPTQWIALGIGLYAAVSWSQALRLRDRVSFELIFRTPTLWYAGLSFSFLAFLGYGIGFWIPPFFVRVHGVPAAEAGVVLGGMSAVGGWLGITLGGVLADHLRRSTPRGRLYVAMLTASLPVPLIFALLAVQSTTLAYALVLPVSLCGSMWVGAGASTVQDLVLPRMRATASAAYLLLVTFIGLALGPYSIGLLSSILGDLRRAMLTAVAVNALAFLFALLAARRIAEDEASVRERASAAGEPGVAGVRG